MKINILLIAAALGLAGCASQPDSGTTPATPPYNDNRSGQNYYNKDNGADVTHNASADNNGINDNISGKGDQFNNGTNFNTTPDSAPVITTNLPPNEPNKG